MCNNKAYSILGRVYEILQEAKIIEKTIITECCKSIWKCIGLYNGQEVNNFEWCLDGAYYAKTGCLEMNNYQRQFCKS